MLPKDMNIFPGRYSKCNTISFVTSLYFPIIKGAFKILSNN